MIISIQAEKSVCRWLRVVGAIILLSAIGGCIGKENRPDTEVPVQNVDENDNPVLDNPVLEKNASNINASKSNQVHLGISRSREFKKTRQLNVTLNITNPKYNETVNVLFKPEFGTEGRYRAKINDTAYSTWSKKFSLELMKNTSYVQMLIQILENNKTSRTADCNIAVLDVKRTTCKVT